MSLRAKFDDNAGAQIVDDFQVYLRSEKRLSLHSVNSYIFDLKSWMSLGLKVESMSPPNSKWVRDTLAHFSEKEKLKSSSIARRQATLRAFVKYKNISSPLWDNMLKYLPSGKSEESWPEAKTLDEIESFLDFTPTSLEKDALRNKALLELMYASGLRVSEVAALEWNQVDERAGVLRVIGKGQKERIVPFSERAWQWLERYRKDVWSEWSESAKRADSKKIFLSHLHRPLSRMGIWKIVHKRSLVAGLDHVHPHVLRHSFATHLIQGGADVRFVQAMLGHSSLNTTERYLKVADSELIKMVEKHHPLFRKK